MTAGFYFDQAGERMELLAWADAFSDFDSRVLEDRVVVVGVTSVRVLTMWHGFDPLYPIHGGEPLIFGTLITGGPRDGQEQAYATRDEARRGHADVVGEHLQLAQEAS